MFKVVFLVLALFLGGSAAALPPCDLACWLGNLTIDLGAEKFEGGTIESFVCSGLVLGGLKSAFLPPNALGMNVSGLDIECAIVAKVDILGTYDLKATSLASSLKAAAQFVNSSSGLASHAILSSCDADVKLDVKVPKHPIFKLIVDLVLKVYGPRLNKKICAALTTLVQDDLTTVLSDVNLLMQPFLNGGGPPPSAPNYGGRALNFTGNAFFGLVDWLLDDLIGANGPFGINLIVSAITNSSGRAEINFPNGGITLGTFEVSSLGNVSLGVSNLSFKGLNTFKRLEALVPRAAYSLDSLLEMLDFGLNASFFVNTTVGESGTLHGRETSLFETGELRFEAQNLSVGLDVAAGIDRRMASMLTFDQLLSGGCLKDTVMGGNVTQARLEFGLRQLLMVAVSNGDQLEGSLDDLIDNLLLLFVTSYNHVIPAFVNAVLLTPAVEAANTAITDKVLRNFTPCALAPPRNAASSAYPLNPTGSLVVLVAASVVFLGVSAIMIVLHVVRYGEHANDPDEDGGSSTEDGGMGAAERMRLLSVQGDQVYDPHSFAGPDAMVVSKSPPSRLTPIGLDPRVWWILKLMVPFLIIGNIGAFIVSNVSTGASVFVYIHLGANHTVSSSSLFSFTLANSVHDMWVAGVYPLSLVIALFSGTWPYVKLLSMLVVWLMPLKAKLREKILTFLDMMGKWSLIDAFVLVFMMVAFRFVLVIPGSPQAHTKTGDARLDLVVEAGLGFYLFLLATMFSLVITHIELAVHRWVEEKDEKLGLIDEDGAQVIRSSPMLIPGSKPGGARAIFQMRHRLGDGSVVRASMFGTVSVVVLLVGSFGLVIGGALINSFTFHFRGAAGAIFPYAGVPSVRYYSLVSLALDLPSAALSSNAFGVRWVQATFLVFSLVVPLAYLLMLFILWIVPLKSVAQGRLFVLTEVLRAWSAMEVFVLAVIVALTELEKFAQFLVGSRCDFINPFLGKYFGPLIGGDAKCFDVTTTLANGCWLMFAAVVIYIVAGQVVMTLVHEAIFPKLSDKEERSRLVRFLLWAKLAREEE